MVTSKVTMDRELIEEKFTGVYSRLDANNQLMHMELKAISELLQKTHEQTLKTNGRVNGLESDIKKTDFAVIQFDLCIKELDEKINGNLNAIKLLKEQTAVSRWFQIKPQRYLLFFIPFLAAIKEVRDFVGIITKWW